MGDPSRRLDDGVARSLDPRSIVVERIGGLIAAAVLSLATFVGAIATWLSGSRGYGPGAALFAGWALLTALLGLRAAIWPAVRYRHARWRLDADGIRIERGVFWRSSITVPRSRVQHTDVAQGPVERAFGLATLVLHTAGTEHAAIALAGLDRETAEGLRDHLILGERSTLDGT